jgi:transcriptional regulator of acetoin/glycerol metabolism
MTLTKDIDVAIDACRGADGTVDARRMAAALATPARATEAPSRSLAEIGRDAARKAQREALLATLEACGWNLSEAARVGT